MNLLKTQFDVIGYLLGARLIAGSAKYNFYRCRLIASVSLMSWQL